MRLTESHIYLRNMRVYAYHGVLPQERVVGGEYVVNVDVKYDVGKAVLTDQVDDTLNYAVLHDIVMKEMTVPSKLLEHVAGRIGQAVFDNFIQAEEVEIDIRKVVPPFGGDSDGAGVILKFRGIID